MKELSGCLTARLADSTEAYPLTLIDEINRRVNPPKPITGDQVHIRAMYIVSDQINSQGGCFAPEDLHTLAQLLADSPVMVGHRRDSLPLARNFLAEVVQQDGRSWVKSYFYWMKQSDGGEDLRNNIDGGIYKECSISFLFSFPECSICGQDIRRCRHLPFQEYETASGNAEIAYFKYRQIERVLETSLVFRGAVPDTKITDRLASDPSSGDMVGTVSAELFTKTSVADDPTGEKAEEQKDATSLDALPVTETLALHHGKDRLTLIFKRNGGRTVATIYHFSPKLLGLGRRFVADFETDKIFRESHQDFQAVPLKSVAQHGKLICLRPVSKNVLLGNAVALWFRPVLIDGQERYLFYSDALTDLRPEL